jgi:hypothetical protein
MFRNSDWQTVGKTDTPAAHGPKAARSASHDGCVINRGESVPPGKALHVETAVTVLASVGLAAAVPAALAVARRAVRLTSLTSAWWWAVAAAAVWIAVWTRGWDGAASHGWMELAWYFAAVGMLCPPVAVLGARRPGAAAWTWFVVLPLLVVLSLPAVTAVALGGGGGGGGAGEVFTFHLEGPWAIGYGLVLVMGVGNYLGTRMTISALAYAAAAVLLVGPFVEGLAEWFPSMDWSRRWAALCLSLSASWMLVSMGSPGQMSPLERLWRDFRNLFGVVWSRRVMDRVNQALADRKLSARLEWSGLVWTGPRDRQAEEFQEAERHAEQTLRWLLKRFVSPEWIEARMGGPDASDPDAPSVRVTGRVTEKMGE